MSEEYDKLSLGLDEFGIRLTLMWYNNAASREAE